MSELEVLDYSQIALSLLIERFKDSEDIQKLLEVITDASMDLHNTIFEIRDRFILVTAEGAELTIIGRVWDVFRNLEVTETDDEYRDKIEVKTVLTASGTISELKEILYFFYGATYVDYVAAYPAGFHLLTNANITQLVLNSITASGVQGFLGSRLEGTTMPFLLGRAVWRSTS